MNLSSTSGIPRRALLNGAGAGAVAAGVAAAGLAACTSPTGSSPPDTERRPQTPGAGAAAGGRVLLAYFSRAGENYWNGGRKNLETGNTEVLADLIRTRTGCDVHRIEAQERYSDRYDPTVRRNTEEQDRNARPALARAAPDVSAYDTVILGSPIWNVQPPMIMATFAEAVDLREKLVLPIVTYAVSGLGSTESFYRGLGTGGRLGPGLAIRGEEVRTPASADEVASWVRSSGLA